MKIYFKRHLLVLCVLAVTISQGFGQKDQTLFFGGNVGVKLANKNYAVRYSGAYQDELYYALINPINYNELYIRLGDKTYYVPYDSYPTNMRYSPGIVTGVTAGYQVSPNFQMSLDANFSKLKIKDAFTIVVEDPSNWTSEPVIEVGTLYAEESRFDGRFNLDYVFDGDKARFVMGLSGMFTAWRIDEHFASIRGYNMYLFSQHNPTNNFNNKVSGMGWGGGLNIGCEYRVNEKIVAQLMYQPYHTKVDYGYTISKRLILQHDLTVRFLWK